MIETIAKYLYPSGTVAVLYGTMFVLNSRTVPPNGTTLEYLSTATSK